MEIKEGEAESTMSKLSKQGERDGGSCRRKVKFWPLLSEARAEGLGELSAR